MSRGRTASSTLLVVVITITAFNLRPVVTSIGPVLRELQVGLGMSDTVAGVLTSLPVVCFGVVGLLAGRIGRRVGVERALVVGLVLLAGGMLVRSQVTSAWVFLLVSFLALTGAAVGNVLLPVLVKRWFPGRVGTLTGVYSMSVISATALPAVLTVPLAAWLGGWEFGLAIWALPALLALIPWMLVTRSEVGDRGLPPAVPPGGRDRRVHHSRQAWALAVYFGLQSLEAYTVMGWLPAILRDAGLSPTRSGVLLGVAMAIGAPLALLLPSMAARRPDQRPLVAGLIVASVGGYVGLILAPAVAPTVWIVLLGIGLGAFPLALVLIGLRSATSQGTAGLSSLTQGVGYLIAALGPITVGALHDRTGGWEWPIGILAVLLIPKLWAGLIAAAPGFVDRADTALDDHRETTGQRRQRRQRGSRGSRGSRG